MKKGLGKGLAALIGDLDEDIDSQGIKDEAGLGYGPEIEFPALELTHNWDQETHYDKGNGWGHICIETPDVYKAVEDLEASGAKILSPAKPMNAGTRILAFIEDPDGYVVELNENG